MRKYKYKKLYRFTIIHSNDENEDGPQEKLSDGERMHANIQSSPLYSEYV